VGNACQIINASPCSEAFADKLPAAPGAGLVWEVAQLNAGRLLVGLAPPFPVVNRVAWAGDNLIFSGTNGTAVGGYAVLMAAELALPLADWTALATNVFDANGNFQGTNPVVPGMGQRFFRLQTQ